MQLFICFHIFAFFGYVFGGLRPDVGECGYPTKSYSLNAGDMFMIQSPGFPKSLTTFTNQQNVQCSTTISRTDGTNSGLYFIFTNGYTVGCEFSTPTGNFEVYEKSFDGNKKKAKNSIIYHSNSKIGLYKFETTFTYYYGEGSRGPLWSAFQAFVYAPEVNDSSSNCWMKGQTFDLMDNSQTIPLFSQQIFNSYENCSWTVTVPANFNMKLTIPKLFMPLSVNDQLKVIPDGGDAISLIESISQEFVGSKFVIQFIASENAKEFNPDFIGLFALVTAVIKTPPALTLFMSITENLSSETPVASEPSSKTPTNFETSSETPTTFETSSTTPTNFETSSETPTTFETSSETSITSEPSSTTPTAVETSSETPITFETSSETPSTFKTSSETSITFETSSETPTTFKTSSETSITFETSSTTPTNFETSSETPTTFETSSETPITFEPSSTTPTAVETSSATPTNFETSSETPTTFETSSETPITFETSSQTPTTFETSSETPTTFETSSETSITSEPSSTTPTAVETSSATPTNFETSSETPTTFETSSETPITFETSSQTPTTFETSSETPTTFETSSETSITSELSSTMPTTFETSSETPTTFETSSETSITSEPSSTTPTAVETSSATQTNFETSSETPTTFATSSETPITFETSSETSTTFETSSEIPTTSKTARTSESIPLPTSTTTLSTITSATTTTRPTTTTSTIATTTATTTVIPTTTVLTTTSVSSTIKPSILIQITLVPNSPVASVQTDNVNVTTIWTIKTANTTDTLDLFISLDETNSDALKILQLFALQDGSNPEIRLSDVKNSTDLRKPRLYVSKNNILIITGSKPAPITLFFRLRQTHAANCPNSNNVFQPVSSKVFDFSFAGGANGKCFSTIVAYGAEYPHVALQDLSSNSNATVSVVVGIDLLHLYFDFNSQTANLWNSVVLTGSYNSIVVPAKVIVTSKYSITEAPVQTVANITTAQGVIYSMNYVIANYSGYNIPNKSVVAVLKGRQSTTVITCKFLQIETGDVVQLVQGSKTINIKTVNQTMSFTDSSDITFYYKNTNINTRGFLFEFHQDATENSGTLYGISLIILILNLIILLF